MARISIRFRIRQVWERIRPPKQSRESKARAEFLLTAGEKIYRKGLNGKLETLDRFIKNGGVNWLEPEQHQAATVVVMAKLAGIKLTKKNAPQVFRTFNKQEIRLLLSLDEIAK